MSIASSQLLHLQPLAWKDLTARQPRKTRPPDKDEDKERHIAFLTNFLKPGEWYSVMEISRLQETIQYELQIRNALQKMVELGLVLKRPRVGAMSNMNEFSINPPQPRVKKGKGDNMAKAKKTPGKSVKKTVRKGPGRPKKA